nr:p20 [Pineapple mealybug wilt-associated virus 6]
MSVGDESTPRGMNYRGVFHNIHYAFHHNQTLKLQQDYLLLRLMFESNIDDSKKQAELERAFLEWVMRVSSGSGLSLVYSMIIVNEVGEHGFEVVQECAIAIMGFINRVFKTQQDLLCCYPPSYEEVEEISRYYGVRVSDAAATAIVGGEMLKPQDVHSVLPARSNFASTKLVLAAF